MASSRSAKLVAQNSIIGRVSGSTPRTVILIKKPFMRAVWYAATPHSRVKMTKFQTDPLPHVDLRQLDGEFARTQKREPPT
jgi:hypothetical protein